MAENYITLEERESSPPSKRLRSEFNYHHNHSVIMDELRRTRNYLSSKMNDIMRRLDDIELRLSRPRSPYDNMVEFFCKKYGYNPNLMIEVVESLARSNNVDRFKMAMCKNGRECPDGSRCRFAHFLEEIKDATEKPWEVVNY